MIYYANFFTEDEDLLGKIACADALRDIQVIAKEKNENLVSFPEYDKEILADFYQNPTLLLKMKRLAAIEIRQYCADSTASMHQKQMQELFQKHQDEMQEALDNHQKEMQEALKKQRLQFMLIGLSIICIVLLTMALT